MLVTVATHTPRNSYTGSSARSATKPILPSSKVKIKSLCIGHLFWPQDNILFCVMKRQ